MKNFNNFLNEQNGESFKYNGMIDYTLLDNSVDDKAIIDLCRKAEKYGTKSVCVMPKHVALAAQELKDSSVLVCTVISFPEGTNSEQEKIKETHQVISAGADEVDMVLNYELLKDKWNNGLDDTTHNYLVREVERLHDLCHSSDNKEGDEIILKVIVESGLLTLEQTKVATDICLDAATDFIKTSTGMVSVGAELDKIKIMSNTIKEDGFDMKIKASGGVRSMEDIKSYLPYVDRYGMGFGSVDKLNGMDTDVQGY